MVKRYHFLFLLTGIILHEELLRTTLIHYYKKKREAVGNVEALVTLLTFVEMFAV